MRLYSYVVHHDTGYAPNADGRYCTLVCCKFSTHSHWKNIVELAEEGDWIVGTGGASARSAGHGKIVYAMEVTQKLSLQEYCANGDFQNRSDAKIDPGIRSSQHWRSALISNHYYYFGRNAIPIPPEFALLEKQGPGFMNRFEQEFISRFLIWLKQNRLGKTGEPCAPMPRDCPAGCSHVRRTEQ